MPLVLAISTGVAILVVFAVVVVLAILYLVGMRMRRSTCN